VTWTGSFIVSYIDASSPDKRHVVLLFLTKLFLTELTEVKGNILSVIFQRPVRGGIFIAQGEALGKKRKS
jgi:hypothetical protein